MTKHDQIMKIIEQVYTDCKAEGKPVTADIIGEIMYGCAGAMYDQVHTELDRYKESWADAEPPPGFPLLQVRDLLDIQAETKARMLNTMEAALSILETEIAKHPK